MDSSEESALAGPVINAILAARSPEELTRVLRAPHGMSQEEIDFALAMLATQARSQGRVSLADIAEHRRLWIATVLGAPEPRTDEPVSAAQALLRTPLGQCFVELAEAREWPAWQRLLTGHPELYGPDCLRFLQELEPHTSGDDRWVVEHLHAFLRECRDDGPSEAMSRWPQPAMTGEGAALPLELSVIMFTEAVRMAEEHSDPPEEVLGSLGQLLYRRVRGDQEENIQRAIEVLETAVAGYDRRSEPIARATYQQSLANALLRLDGQEAGDRALEVTRAALEGWSREEHPGLWARIRTSRGNALRQSGGGDSRQRIAEAIHCYEEALTIRTRDRDLVGWALTTYGLAAAYGRLADEHGPRSAHWDRVISLAEACATVRTKERDPYRWALTQQLLGQAYTAASGADAEEGLRCLRDSLTVFRPGMHPREWVQSKLKLGEALSRPRHGGDEAVHHLTEALLVASSHELPDLHTALAGAYAVLPDPLGLHFTTAIHHAEQAVERSSRERDVSQWILAHLKLAALLLQTRRTGSRDKAEDTERAIDRLKEALAAVSTPPATYPELRQSLLAWLSGAYRDRLLGDPQHNLELAVDYGEEAAAAYAEGADPFMSAFALIHLGLALQGRPPTRSSADSGRAVTCFRSALDALDGTDALQLRPEISSHLGGALLDRGEPGDAQSAIGHLQGARRSFRRSGEAESLASTHLLLARAYGRVKGHQEAQLYSARVARRLLGPAGDPQQFAQACSIEGQVHEKRQAWREAAKAYRQAADARRRAHRTIVLPSSRDRVLESFPQDVATKACAAFVRAARECEEERDRQGLLWAAVTVLDQGLAQGISGAWGSDQLAEAQLADGHPELLARYRSALERHRAASGADRLHALASQDPRFAGETADWLVQRGEAKAAWAELEDLAQEIRALSPALQTDFAPEFDPAVLKHGEAVAYVLEDGPIVRILAGLRGVPHEAADHATTESGERPALSDLLADVRGLGAVAEQIESPRLKAVHVLLVMGNVDGAPPMVDSLTIPAPRSLAQFFLQVSNQHLFSALGVAASAGPLRSLLDSMLTGLGASLASPLAARLTDRAVRHLFLVPCGRLSTVPLHACLYADANGRLAPLMDAFPVSYLPSVATLQGIRAMPTPLPLAPPRLLSVVDPEPTAQPLPYAHMQRRLVAESARESSLHVCDLHGDEATAERVLEELALTGVHYADFACHGFFDHFRPTLSGLRLAGRSLLPAAMLMDTRALTGVRAVTLASCQSATWGQLLRSEDMVGLSTAVLQAGAQAVVGTLWPVNDMASGLLVAEFYRRLLVDRAGSAAAALREAQLWLRDLTLADAAVRLGRQEGTDKPLHARMRPYADPTHWAAYVLLGD